MPRTWRSSLALAEPCARPEPGRREFSFWRRLPRPEPSPRSRGWPVSLRKRRVCWAAGVEVRSYATADRRGGRNEPAA